MRFRRFAEIALGYNLLVILWGAYVRASGSGAGCGRHWPLCNGAVVPRTASAATLIEYTHRITSGLALLLVLGLAIWAFRLVPRGARLRKAAGASVVFIVIEALVGAGLVLLELVGDDSSLLRAGYLAVHLANTFCLLAALLLVVIWSEPEPEARPEVAAPGIGPWAVLGLILFTGVTGAITALGDTLFPAGTLAEGLAQDQDPTAHLLIRLRVFHPALAIVTAIAASVVGYRVATRPGSPTSIRSARWLIGLSVGQLAVGTVNLLLLVPIATQLLHLLVADLLWMAGVAVIGGREVAGGRMANGRMGDGRMVGSSVGSQMDGQFVGAPPRD